MGLLFSDVIAMKLTFNLFTLRTYIFFNVVTISIQFHQFQRQEKAAMFGSPSLLKLDEKSYSIVKSDQFPFEKLNLDINFFEYHDVLKVQHQQQQFGSLTIK